MEENFLKFVRSAGEEMLDLSYKLHCSITTHLFNFSCVTAVWIVNDIFLCPQSFEKKKKHILVGNLLCVWKWKKQVVSIFPLKMKEFNATFNWMLVIKYSSLFIWDFLIAHMIIDLHYYVTIIPNNIEILTFFNRLTNSQYTVK